MEGVSEWSERMDIAGSNHWLPAYGFQQPNQLQQVLLQQQQQHQEGAELIGNDGGTVLITGQQQQFLFLETIVEETSDDLRSESDRSGPAGWPDSDSDTESVIHVPSNLEERADWSGSERDLAVPKKRRRRHGGTTDSNDEEATSLSRSSSLLQFECLEKHCDDVFRTTDPFPPPSPASGISSFSFDSLESNRWRFSASPDSLDEDRCDSTGPSSTSSSGDEGASSDDTLHHSSWSSSRGSSFRSSGGSRLRSFRSFDSLNLLQQNNSSHHSLAELSQSLNSTFLLQHPRADLSQTDVPAEITTQKNCSSQESSSTTDSSATVKDADCNKTSDAKSDPTVAKQQRSAENLSEDSGFGDHCCIPASSSTTVTVGTIVEDEDGDNDNDSCTSSYYSDCSAGGSSGGAAGSSETSETERKGTPKRKVLKLVRESEKRGWETDESKFNGSCWQSAPSLLTREGKSVRSKFGSGQDQLSSVPHDLNLAGEHDDEDDDEDTFERYSDAHSSPAVASPQRTTVDEEVVSENPAQEPQYKMASRLPIASTPNLTYTGQDDFLRHELRHSSMTQVPLKDGMPEENHRPISKSLTPLPTKGVHFSPVVSEVSWRDSYSDDGAESVHENKEENEEADEEEMERALMSLEKGEEVAVRVQKTPMPLTLQKLQIGLPVGPEERERYVMELNDNDLLALQPPAPPVTPTSHVVHSTATITTSSSNTTVSAVPMEAKQGSDERRDSDLSSTSSGKKSGKFGSFFQRFSLRRLSGRVVGSSSKNKHKEEKKKGTAKKVISNANPTSATAAVYEDVTIIPLHPPAPETKPAPPDVVVVSSKPPLPPLPPRGGGVVASANKTTPSTRRRPEAAASSSPSLPARAQCDATSGGNNGLSPGQLNMSVIDPARRPPPLGLLETDLDSVVRRQNGATTTTTSKKARSLMNLGDAGNQRNIRAGHGTEDAMHLKPPNSAGPAMTSSSNGGHRPLPYGAPTDARAKSMEFLLDKENQAAVQPPENELQKGSGAAGERVMSEHQLRVQRSLQKLNVPDWYKNSSVARGPEGFLLKRGSDSGQGARDGWPGLGSKTTSLSSLGSTQSAATARSPTSHLLSPSPTPHVFTRWSTSRLNSGGTSASTSPCGSTRSSFNYRQPYLGWRSQERLSRPRTPAERLAAGLLPATSPQQAPQQMMLSSPLDHKQIMKHEEELAQLQREREADDEMMQQVPNLSEVRTSIKEVTSAIVHYVSGVGGAGASQWDSLSPPISGTTPRSGSPRGSSGRLCWLESSFVGSRPLDSPETPLTLPSGDVSKTLESLQQQQQQQQQQQEATKIAHAVPDNLYLELNTVPQHQVNGPEEELHNKPSPGSTTLEDVLDSLLGLPPTSRSPSPAPATASPCRPPPPTPPRSTHHGHHHHHHRHHHHHHHNQRRSCGDLAGSASDGDQQPATPPQQQPPPYYVSDTLRRRSEGSAQQHQQQQQQMVSGGGRRVSFDMSQQQPQAGQQHQAQQDESAVVRCRYSKCGKTASVAEARRTFKTCHNCSHVYCSRECRRAHWEKHRKTCLHSRVGALCRQVLATAREDPATLRHLSLLARRGYLAQGRGAVKSFFSSPELAERFVANGFSDLGEPAFVRWADLLPGEMGADLYSELLRLCKSYNPDTRFVLYVAVCVVSEVPTTGAVKWERQLVSRCAKLRLCRSLQHQGGTPTPATAPATPQRRGPSPCNITRDSENPETLILTSLPGCQGQMSPQRAREISFTNIQRHLRQRGVSLRRHFPDVYKRLLAYVEGSTERFTPVTVYPRDAVTGKSFMCIIMPDAEPEKLELVPRDSSRVQTIDISLEHDPA